ncbi:hypothetical protein [Stenotrophomonas chelatiphaga]|uniref:hypothetical protein n=1 Tax=Stenotrophomonas chelatiphaga TaxID=517011 RepID=UPI002898C696|nr:hypothetical protein [Stenotrophomonas chelatiphaga]
MGTFNVPVLVVAAALTALAALLHLVVIVQGPRGYQWCGAGDRIVAAARSGSRVPAALTSMICVVLLAWAAYALSGAGLIAPLPLLRPMLVAIASVFLLRALLGPFVLVGNGRSARFVWVSSAICLVYGLLFLVGLVQRWDALPA